MTTKRCMTCGLDLPIEAFKNYTGTWANKQSDRCRSCDLEAYRRSRRQTSKSNREMAKRAKEIRRLHNKIRARSTPKDRSKDSTRVLIW